ARPAPKGHGTLRLGSRVANDAETGSANLAWAVSLMRQTLLRRRGTVACERARSVTARAVTNVPRTRVAAAHPSRVRRQRTTDRPRSDGRESFRRLRRDDQRRQRTRGRDPSRRPGPAQLL